MSENDTRPQMLCVDDEPAVLEGLELRLHKQFALTLCTSGDEALGQMQVKGPFAIVLSDMRMPGMDGAALLAKVRECSPDTVRMLLTGFADMDAAAAAVNDGQVFRFLIKPCKPEVLLRAVADALHQHQLQRVERDLLERTLRGAVKVLCDVLSLSDPEGFGRAARIRDLAVALAGQAGIQPLWPLEVAALLAPMGEVSVPPEVLRKARQHVSLMGDEQAMVARVPQVTDQLLASIPRLDDVREILRLADRSSGGELMPSGTETLQSVLRSARALRLARDFDDLESEGTRAGVAVAELQRRSGHYEEPLLQALSQLKGAAARGAVVRHLSAQQLIAGMVLADDLMTTGGQRLMARGATITDTLVERLRNLRPGVLREPIRILQRQDMPAEHAA